MKKGDEVLVRGVVIATPDDPRKVVNDGSFLVRLGDLSVAIKPEDIVSPPLDPEWEREAKPRA